MLQSSRLFIVWNFCVAPCSLPHILHRRFLGFRSWRSVCSFHFVAILYFALLTTPSCIFVAPVLMPKFCRRLIAACTSSSIFTIFPFPWLNFSHCYISISSLPSDYYGFLSTLLRRNSFIITSWSPCHWYCFLAPYYHDCFFITVFCENFYVAVSWSPVFPPPFCLRSFIFVSYLLCSRHRLIVVIFSSPILQKYFLFPIFSFRYHGSDFLLTHSPLMFFHCRIFVGFPFLPFLHWNL